MIWGHFVVPSFRITLLPDGTLRITNVTKMDSGTYSCLARNQFGAASTTGRLLVTGEGYYYLLSSRHLQRVSDNSPGFTVAGSSILGLF